MKTSLYRDKLWIFKSGISTAFEHQRIALSKVGVEVAAGMSPDSDAVHFNWYSPLSRWKMKKARARGQKAVVFAHTANDLRQSFKYSRLVEPIVRHYLAGFYSRADLLVAPTEYCKRLIQGEGYNVANRVHVISNGVDTDRFVFSQEKRREYRRRYNLSGPTVVTAGQFIPRKGVVDFIEVARRLPHYTFIWFGPITSKWLSFSEGMRRALANKPDNLIVAGFVDDIVAALCCGDLFLFPSYEENQGIALLEAACIGLPIVLRPLPVYEGWLKYGENCLAAETIDEFAEAVQRVYEDNDLRSGLSGKAHEMAMGHNLRAVGQQLLAAYREELGIAAGEPGVAGAQMAKANTGATKHYGSGESTATRT